MSGFRPLSVATFLFVTISVAASAQSFAMAQREARAGKIDAALAALGSGTAEPAANALRCSLYASIEQYDLAIQACEAASSQAPRSSDYALALARAYGEKADHAGALTGMRMVGKIRSGFERAVQLNPSNVEALSDLGEFYVDAPGIVGGGTDKAAALVQQLQPLSPERAHRLAGMIAEKRGDDAEALQQYRQELAGKQTAEAYVDLARYYQKKGQWNAAAQNALLALQHDPAHGPDTLDAARLLISMRRNIPEAQAALRDYLKSPQQNVAHYAAAHVMLARTLQTSDPAAARAEYTAALALARDYAAAQQGLTR